MEVPAVLGICTKTTSLKFEFTLKDVFGNLGASSLDVMPPRLFLNSILANVPRMFGKLVCVRMTIIQFLLNLLSRLYSSICLLGHKLWL